jgi:hypothetical protein
VRRPLALLLTVLALVLPVVASPASAASRCDPKGSKLHKKKGKVRVFTREARNGATRYYGCVRGGRRVLIGEDYDSPDDAEGRTVKTLRIAGTSVAVVNSSFVEIGPEGDERESIVVEDLRRGGRSYFSQIRTDDRYSHFARVILRADGVAAWVVEGNNDYTEIDVLGRDDERATPVAWAKGIVSTSLRFGGSGVTWLQGGATRTATIP